MHINKYMCMCVCPIAGFYIFFQIKIAVIISSSSSSSPSSSFLLLLFLSLSLPPPLLLLSPFFFFFFVLSGPHLWHMEVPRVEVESELQVSLHQANSTILFHLVLWYTSSLSLSLSFSCSIGSSANLNSMPFLFLLKSLIIFK